MKALLLALLSIRLLLGRSSFRQGHYAQAKAALDKALQTAPRPGRELADSGRRKDIQLLLVDVNKKLK